MKTLRSNIERAKNAKIFMMIMAILSGVSVLVECYRYYFFNSIFEGAVTYEEATQFDSLYLIFNVVNLIIYVVVIIFFIMWFRRAYYNLHQLTRGLRYSEGWAAGAWFVPIFSLFGPYQIATDLFSRTEGLLINHNLTESKPQRHTIKGWWWGLWIAGSITGNIQSDSTMDMLMFSVVMSIVSGVLLTVAAILAIKVIDNYHEM
ncbi:MAG: DUF4328 domain-containing protein, partial [bacterium]|nr:DUF4328 domain-containing protein [bacterium]